jgi:cell division septation protein DedD
MLNFTNVARKIIALVFISTPVMYAQDLTASIADELNVSIEKVDVAKKTAVLNKKVKLTNLDSGKSVTVRINDRISDDKVALLTKSASNEAGLEGGKMKIKIQELEADDEIERFWATSEATPKVVKDKEVSIETTKLAGFNVNHVYDLKGNVKNLDGYGLQLAAFAQLKAAKDFAEKISEKGQAEKDKLFIQVSKSEDKPMVYRVLYGFFEGENAAKETQKQMENIGLQAFVKGFN